MESPCTPHTRRTTTALLRNPLRIKAFDPPRWKEITPSEFPWEREALDFVRVGLPDHEPFRAWSNFTFIGRDGSLNEVDLLVAAPTGIFLVEIKSRPAEITGDAGTWVWTHDGRAYTDDTRSCWRTGSASV